MAEKIPVRFIKPHSLYNTGEVAGFVPDEAHDLVRSEKAVFLDPELQLPEDLAGAGSELPETFPGVEHLLAAGIHSLEQLREVEDLTDVPGIGKKTAEAILEQLG